MEYKLKSGAVITGTFDQIKEIAKSLGETVSSDAHYYSSSKDEWLKISDMEDGHIRNALLKRSREFFEELSALKKATNTDFLQKYTQLVDDKVVINLFSELQKRK